MGPGRLTKRRNMESRLINNAEHWHSRAEEARVDAEQMHDAKARADARHRGKL
jgi:hypothetical protein